MALQTKTIPSSPANNYTLNLILTENSTSITDNTSSVSWQLQLVTSYYGFSGFRVGWSVSLAGRVVSSQTWSNASSSSIAKNNGTLTIASGTSNVAHNADGSLNMACAASFFVDPSRTDSFLPPRANATTGERSPTVSGSMTLTTIPRASTLTAANGTLNTQQTLTINRASSSFTHTLTYACGSLTGQTAGLGSITGSGTTQTCPFTPPVSLAAQNTSGQSVSVTFTLTTKNGSATVGTSTKTVSVAIPASVKPTASAAVAVVNDNATVNSWGVAVKGYSRYKVTTTFTGAQGSTLKSRSVKVNATGQTLTASPATSSVLTSTTRTVIVKVVDSRDRPSAEVTVTGPVIYDYGNPTISEATACRCNSAGSADDAGTYLYVKCTGTVYTCGGHNVKTVQYRRRATGGNWSNWAALTNGAATVVNAGLDAVVSYEVQFRVSDSLGKARTVTVTIPTAAVTLNLRPGGRGAAFGKYAEKDDTLQLAWDLELARPLPVAQGGTGQSAVYQTVTVTADSTNLTDAGFTCRYNPYLGMVFMRGNGKTAAATSANAWITVAAIPEAYRPKQTTAIVMSVPGGGSGLARYTGEIMLRTFTERAAGTSVDFSGWWFV